MGEKSTAAAWDQNLGAIGILPNPTWPMSLSTSTLKKMC